MKKIFGFLVMVEFGLFLLTQRLKAEEGLVGYWSFDEGEGTIAHDYSGNSNDGTIYGATWVDGKVGKALSFDGVDDYVRVNDSSNFDITDAITIEAWIKPIKTTGDHQIIVQSGEDEVVMYWSCNLME
jgi:hypothetical protein